MPSAQRGRPVEKTLVRTEEDDGWAAGGLATGWANGAVQPCDRDVCMECA